MSDLLSSFAALAQGSPLVGLLIAFAWGIISVALNPCHLAVIPLVAGLIAKQAGAGTARAYQIATALALGTLASFAAIGLLTAAAGKLAGEVAWLESLLAVIFIALGLNLIGILPLPHFHPHFHAKGSGMLPAFALGLLYGCAHGPSCLAFMVPLMALAFGVAAHSATYAGLMLLSFGLGHAAVILLAGAATGAMLRYTNWNERSKAHIILSRVSGALVLLIGAYMLAEPWLSFGR